MKDRHLPTPILGAFGCLWTFPVAVPNKIFGLTLILDFIDRSHSLPSLDSATGGGRVAPRGRVHGWRSADRRSVKRHPFC